MANIVNQYGQVKVGVRVQSSGSSGGSISIDADAQAFITAASITDTTQQSAINTLVTQLKTYGIWTKLKAVYPFVGGTASAHKFNLKDPRDLDVAYRLTFGGGWTHSSTGAQPNGTNGYANTFFIPNTQTQYNQHLSYYTTNNGMALSGRYKAWLGAYHTSWETGYTGLHEFYIGAGNTSVSSIQYSETNVNNYVKKSETSPIGFWTGTRLTSGLDLRLFKNGTKVDTITASPASQYQPDHHMYLGAIHVKYASQDYADNFSDNNTAFASIGDGLSDTEAANFYTAVQTFQTTLGRNVGVPIVADTDAQAFLNAAEITNQTQASAINTLVTDLKSANIWTKMKAIYPFVGGTAAQHRFNLKSPGTTAADFYLDFIGGGIHTATGYKGNQSTAYADTKFTGLSNNSCLAYYNRYTLLDDTRVLMGVYNNPDVNTVLASNINNNSHFQIRSLTSRVQYTSTANAGFWMVNRQSQTNLNAWHNGVKKGTDTVSSSTSTQSNSIFINAYNSGFADYYSKSECAFASISDGLTDAEATAFYNAVQAYQTTLGRQV